MNHLLIAAAVAVASPALAQTAFAQEAPGTSHADHAGHNSPAAPAAPASGHSDHTGQAAPAGGQQEGQGMKECCCCGEGGEQGHQAMMRHAGPDAEAAPDAHAHR